MKQEIIRNFRQQLSKDGVIGIFSKTSDPTFIEVSGHAGLDFVIIDLEHSANNFRIAQELVIAAENANIVPIIRVSEGNERNIGTALDIGAYGIQVPHVVSVNDAKSIVNYARYFPDGERGLCRYVRQANYSSVKTQQFLMESNNALVIIQIEGTEALENLDLILDVKGIDIVFIGPYDLSQSLNCPGEVDSEPVIETIADIIDRAQSRGIKTGIFTDTIESLKFWKTKGINYLSYSVDVGIFSEACKSIKEQI
jgi:4-hydroxy-2-oxoheptanedioate aldolase